MPTALDLQDIQVILTALEYRKKSVAESQDHASYEQKQGFLREVDEVIAKVRSLKAGLSKAKA
jgi:hypothetical protein